MAMCTTIVSIREKNIRHLYYGKPCAVVYRTSADYPNLDQLRIAKSERELRENILKSAKQNYSPSTLEPAPAFRCVTAAEAEEIGKRLYAGHRPKNANKNGKEGTEANKNGQGQGRTATAGGSNKQGSQSVKFQKENPGETSSPPPADSTSNSPTPQK